MAKRAKYPSKKEATFSGITRTVGEWAELTGLSEWAVINRHEQGFTVEELHQRYSKPKHRITVNGVSRSYTDWAKLSGVNVETLYARIRRGIPPEKAILPGHQYATRTAAMPKSFDELPYEQDVITQAVVQRFPTGLGLEDIGDLIGVSREAISQTERRALRKLRDATGKAELASIVETLRDLDRDRKQQVYPSTFE